MCLQFCDRRRVPLAGERFGLRGVQPHSQIERPLRRGKPVSLFVRPRAFVLEVKVERAVRVVFERHPATHRKAIEAVCHLKAVTVVERDRPKGIHRRRSALVEMDRVLACAVERLAGFVGEVEWVDRIFRQVRAEAKLRDDGALEIVIAVNAHRVGIHRPVVHNSGNRRALSMP